MTSIVPPDNRDLLHRTLEPDLGLFITHAAEEVKARFQSSFRELYGSLERQLDGAKAQLDKVETELQAERARRTELEQRLMTTSSLLEHDRTELEAVKAKLANALMWQRDRLQADVVAQNPPPPTSLKKQLDEQNIALREYQRVQRQLEKELHGALHDLSNAKSCLEGVAGDFIFFLKQLRGTFLGKPPLSSTTASPSLPSDHAHLRRILSGPNSDLMELFTNPVFRVRHAVPSHDAYLQLQATNSQLSATNKYLQGLWQRAEHKAAAANTSTHLASPADKAAIIQAERDRIRGGLLALGEESAKQMIEMSERHRSMLAALNETHDLEKRKLLDEHLIVAAQLEEAKASLVLALKAQTDIAHVSTS